MTAKKKKPIIALAVVSALLTALIIWIIWGNTALQLNKYTVSSERLPRAFDGCKIAHISDLHNTEIGKNNETLLNMINSGNLSEAQKAEITDQMIHITEVAELENEIETLLEAKGFNGAVVSIGDENVDVVVNMTAVSDTERAKIEDVVKRKTNVSAANIVITPISDEN